MPELTDYPASHVYFSQRLRLHYVDWGNPDAPPLVLVHGGRDHCRSWDWLALRLRKRFHVIAPDLRGHGDSQWVIGSRYAMIDYVYDLAQLVHQKRLEPVTLLGHSLGGRIVLEYAGIFPDRVAKLIAIEGLAPPKSESGPRAETPAHERMRDWIGETYGYAGRQPRRYPTLEDAVARMQQANPRLTAEQARHLTIHGANQEEDGAWTWKFDNYARGSSPYPFNEADASEIWSRAKMPMLLVNGLESAGDPGKSGRADAFPQAEKIGIANAGHWVHHDQLDEFAARVERFLDR